MSTLLVFFFLVFAAVKPVLALKVVGYGLLSICFMACFYGLTMFLIALSPVILTVGVPILLLWLVLKAADHYGPPMR